MPNIIYIPIEIKPGGEMPEREPRITWVDVSIGVFTLFDGVNYYKGYYDYDNDRWLSDGDFEINPTHWLKPVDAEELYSHIWESAVNRNSEDMWDTNPRQFPDKQTFIQSLLNQ